MKIVVIRFSSAGDIILTSLLLRVLRSRFPEAEIVFVTRENYRELVETNSAISRTIYFPDHGRLSDLRALQSALRREQFDVVIDLHNSLRSRLLRPGLAPSTYVYQNPSLRKRILVAVGWNLLRPVVPVPERYLAAVAPLGLENDLNGLEFHYGPFNVQHLPAVSPPYVALAPGARHATKRWPVEYWSLLGRRIIDELQMKVCLCGGVEDREICLQVERLIDRGANVVQSGGCPSWLQTASVIAAAEVTVANDSALGHLSAALDIPVVSIFGSTVTDFGFQPYTRHSYVAEVENLSCRPCTTHGREACPKGHFRCMIDIGIDQVFALVEQALVEGRTDRDARSDSDRD